MGEAVYVQRKGLITASSNQLLVVSRDKAGWMRISVRGEAAARATVRVESSGQTFTVEADIPFLFTAFGDSVSVDVIGLTSAQAAVYCQVASHEAWFPATLSRSYNYPSSTVVDVPFDAEEVRIVGATSAVTTLITAYRGSTPMAALSSPSGAFRVVGLTSLDITATGAFSLVWYLRV